MNQFSEEVAENNKIEQLKSFNQLYQQYYVPKDPIRYIKYRRNPDGSLIPTTVHDIIRMNIQTLIPDVKTQYENGRSIEYLDSWINLSQTYLNQVNSEFQERCKEQRCILKNITSLEEKKERFDLSKIDRLPEDMVRCIYDYLSDDIKLDIIYHKHPMLWNDMYRLNASLLKRTQETMYDKYYSFLSRIVSNKNRVSNSPNIILLRFSRRYMNKNKTIENMITMMNIFRRLKANNIDEMKVLQSKGLKMLKSLIYLTGGT